MSDKKHFGHTIKQFLSKSQTQRKDKFLGEQELTLYTAYLLKEEEGDEYFNLIFLKETF